MPVERTVNEEDFLSAVRDLDPIEFEELVADIYSLHRHNAETTQGSYENGRDVIVRHRFKPGRTLVQVKRYTNKLVGGPDVEQYSGLYSEPGYVRHVVLITSGPVSSEAEKVADRRGVDLISERDIVDWILEMDTQLQVVRQYVDPEEFIEDDWPTLPSHPSGRVLALFVTSITIMLTTIVSSVIQPVSIYVSDFLPVLSGMYLAGSLLTGLGVVLSFQQFPIKKYAWISVLAMIATAIHVCGFLASGYWWVHRLGFVESTSIAAVSTTQLRLQSIATMLPLVSSNSIPDIGVLVHLLTAVLFATGVYQLRRRFQYQLHAKQAK